MGFFSWRTSDTRESIPADGSGRPTFQVHMITKDGRTFTEPKYEGYGVFGGKDIYELIAELNGKQWRSEGIDLVFEENPSGSFAVAAERSVELPKLVRDIKREWWDVAYPENCEYQGWFYPGGEEDDLEDEEDDDDDEAASGY